MLEPSDMRDHPTYVLRFPDGEARRLGWQRFISDSEWRSLKAASEVNGVLLKEVKSRCFDDISMRVLSGTRDAFEELRAMHARALGERLRDI